MSKDFNKFRHEVLSNEDLMANIFDRSLKIINDKPLELKLTPEGIAEYTKSVIQLSIGASVTTSIDILNLYHDWLHDEEKD